MANIGDQSSRDAIRLWIEQQHSELDRMSYYQLLSLPRDAHEAQIREAYYRLVARLHPDLYVETLDPVTRQKLVTIYSRVVEGYRVLTDGAKREHYNTTLGQGKMRQAPEDELKQQRIGGAGGEADLTNPKAKQFYQLGKRSIGSGDGKGAVMNLKFALSMEPDSAFLKAELAKAEALLKSQGG